LTGLHQNPKSELYHLFWCVLDWLYPPYCGGCEKPGSRWCSTCQSNVRKPGGTICYRCGDSLNIGTECQRCSVQKPLFKALRSWGMYEGPLRNAVHSFKYKKNIGLAESLSKHLIDLYYTLNWKVDLIIPVPLSSGRQLERGYNQANLLAYPMSLACRLAYSSRAIRRVRETRSQVGLSTGERLLNVQNAFEADTRMVHGKSVLVIDDVATTGATQQACASALLNAGASTVYGLTLARAVFKNETATTTQTSDYNIS